MSEVPRHRRQIVLRIAALIALVAVLSIFGLGLPFVGGAGDAAPLNPNDVLGLWSEARPAQKRATAELLLSETQGEGTLNLRTETALADPAGKQRLIGELVAALNATTNRNRTEYMSPSLSIEFAATRAMTQMGWRE